MQIVSFGLQALEEQINRLLPRHLADAKILEQHVQLVFDPILEKWSRTLPVFVYQLSGSLSEWLFLPEVVDAVSRKHLISVDMDILISARGKQSLVHLESCGLEVGDLYLDSTNCSPGFSRIARVLPGGEEYVRYKIIHTLTGTSTVGSPAIARDKYYQYFCDEVRCFRCINWPSVAIRIFHRESSWPQPHTLLTLQSTSILLVHKIDSWRKHENWSKPFQKVAQMRLSNNFFAFPVEKKLVEILLPQFWH